MVISPSQSQSHSQSSVPVYVCSRKYIPSEGRVVLLEGAEELQDSKARPCVLVQGNLVPMSQHINPPPINRVITAPQSMQPTQLKASRKSSKRKRFSGQETNLLRPAGSPGSAPGSATTSMGGATSAERSSQQGLGIMPPVVSTPRSRRPVGGHGRWSEERYEGAKAALIHILRMMDATRADKAVLRPALREQARKVIGDTGLLDHLLKHLADQVIAQDGERLRRRHNREGHMEYWLQSPAAAQAEEEMLKEEMQALTSELRQVREARHVLQAVRTEAAQAIQAVTGLKHHPEEALPNLQTPSLVPTSPHVNTRLSALEAADVEFKVRLHDAESFTVSAIEEVRREVASAGVLLGEHIGKFAQVTQDLEARCTALEKDQAAMKEEVAGRFEALASALSQAVTATTMLGQELVRRDNVMMALQHEIAALKNSVYVLQQGQGDQQHHSLPEGPSSPLLRHGNGGPGNTGVPSDLEAALKLPVPGQALEPSTIQDMTVAGVEGVEGGDTEKYTSPSLEMPHIK
jgi:predicted  nucleic acid-binding Zn-ribbon protein